MHYSYCLGLQRRYYNRNRPHLRKNDLGYGGTNQNEDVSLKYLKIINDSNIFTFTMIIILLIFISFMIAVM